MLNLAGVAIVITTLGTWDMSAVITLGAAVVSIISIAAVMRSRVDGLEKSVEKITDWQKDHVEKTEISRKDFDDEMKDYRESHTELHQKIAESLSQLTQIAKDQERRVIGLEAENWRELRRLLNDLSKNNNPLKEKV